MKFEFFLGMGIGIAVGMAGGMLMTPHKKKPCAKNLASRALKALGELVDGAGRALS